MPKRKRIVRDDIGRWLDKSIEIREAVPGMPSEGPYPATMDEVADEIVNWIEAFAHAQASTTLVSKVIERLQRG